MNKHYFKLLTVLSLCFFSLGLKAQNVTISGTSCTPVQTGVNTKPLDQDYIYQANLAGSDPGLENFAGLTNVWKVWTTPDGINGIVSDDQGNFVLCHVNNGTIYYTAKGTALGNVPCNGWVEGSGLYCNEPNIVISGDCETIVADEPEIGLSYIVDLPSGSTIPVTSSTGANAAELVVTIQNTGSGVLNLTGSPAVIVSGDSHVSIKTQPATTTIAAGSSTTFTVEFDPGCDAGQVLSSLSILNNDNDESNFTLSLAGAISGTSIAYDFSDYCLNSSDPTPTISGVTGGTFSSTNLSISASDGTIDLSVNTPSTYTVDYNIGSCAVDSKTVTIKAVPTPEVNGSRIFCSNDGSTELEVVGTYDSYLWSTGADTKKVNATAAHSALDVTVTLNGCSGSTSINTTEVNSPSSTITGDASICNGDDVTIEVESSEIGVVYYLRDNDDNTVIGEALLGDGNALSFSTEALTEDKVYNVYAKKGTLDNTSLNFDGVDDRVFLNTNGEIITGKYTVEAWVKPNSTTGDMTIFSTRYLNSTSTFDFKLQNGNNIHGDIGAALGWITTSADAAFNYEVGQWYHIAYVVTETGYMIYVDGEAAGSGTYVSSIPFLLDNNSPIILGGYNATGESFNGQIDEVRVWNVERTAQEIKDYYTTAVDPSQSGLVAYYDFNDGTGSGVLSDLTANGYDGILSMMDVNTAWVTDPINEITCYAQLTNTVSVDVTTVDTSLVLTGAVLSAHETTTATYQWLDCVDMNVIGGEVESDFTAIVNGNYAVEITENSCVDTSKCISVVVTSINENTFGELFTVYPNPSQGTFTIEFESSMTSEVMVKLYSLSGELLVDTKVIGSTQLEILNEQAPGVYLLEVTDVSHGTNVLRVIKE